MPLAFHLRLSLHCVNCYAGVKVLKCPEGIHNKAFILTMDNGAELFAKLPNSNAGPAHYTTASEVATRYFVSRTLYYIYLVLVGG